MKKINKCIEDFIFAVFHYTPLTLRVYIGRLLGLIASFVPTKDRDIATLQLQAVLPESTDSIVRGVYKNIGQTLFESLNLKPYTDKTSQYIECPDQSFVRELVAQERPVIALTAHYSNWDLLAAYMITQGVTLSTIGRKARNTLLQSILERLRNNYGIKTLWRDKSNGTKDLIRELRAGNTVAALIDQDTRVSSVFSPLLGLPAKTPSGLIALGKKHNAIFVTAFIVRERKMKYTIRVSQISDQKDIQETLDEYNERFGEYLKRHPEQWVWFHKRWRTQPDLDTMSSKNYISFLQSKCKAKNHS